MARRESPAEHVVPPVALPLGRELRPTESSADRVDGPSALPALIRDAAAPVGREWRRLGLAGAPEAGVVQVLLDEIAADVRDGEARSHLRGGRGWPAEALSAVRLGILERLDQARAPISYAELRSLDRAIDARLLELARSAHGREAAPSKEAERRMREGEEQFRRVLLAAPWPVMVHGRSGRVRLVNQAWLEGARIGEAEIPNVFAWLRRAHGEAWSSLAEALDRIFAGEAPTPRELPVRVGGTTRIWSFASSPLERFGGEPAIVTMALDVTERRRAEDELRRQVDLTRAVLDNTASALFLLDREGRTTATNPAALRLTGFAAEELAGRRLHDMVHACRPDGSPYPGAECPIEQAVLAGLPRRAVEETFLRRDGSFFPVECSAAPLFQDGRAAGAVVEARDVSARRLAEGTLRRREEELNRVFTTSPDLLAVAGFDGYFRRTNPAFSRALGFSAEELSARPLYDVVHPDDRERTRLEIEKVGAGADAQRFLIRCLVRDGGHRWVSWNASRVAETSLFVCAGRDVTDERARSEFEGQLIGIVSHDLKNPLAAIQIAASSLLRRAETLDERTLRAAGRIHSSADSALALIRDLLDFTRERLGTGIPIRPEPVDLHALVQRSVAEVEAAHPHRSVLVQQTGRAAGDWDPARLSQVVTNLLVNALTHGTADGPVTVRSWGDEAGASVEIRNVGEPIPEEELEHLFEPLRRGRRAGAGTGTGLGLYIVDRIVRAHRGRIAVTSSAAEGTRFVVRLPLRSPAPDASR